MTAKRFSHEVGRLFKIRIGGKDYLAAKVNMTKKQAGRVMPRSVAVRAGSPFTGLGPVFMKELADHLSSVRMMVLTLFVIVFGAFPVASSLQQLKSAASAVSTLGSSEVFLFLRIFTLEPEQVGISFTAALNFIIPLMAIGLGFDAVNSEFNRRTLSRVLSQPIYRDALLLWIHHRAFQLVSWTARDSCHR